MNFKGAFVLRDKDEYMTQKENQIQQWYLLYADFKNSDQYYLSLNNSNIFLNETYKNMTYNIPNKKNILDHINLFKI